MIVTTEAKGESQLAGAASATDPGTLKWQPVMPPTLPLNMAPAAYGRPKWSGTPGIGTPLKAKRVTRGSLTTAAAVQATVSSPYIVQEAAVSEIFDTFFVKSGFLDSTLRGTNAYLTSNPSKNGLPITMPDLIGHICILVHMGLCKRASTRSYWNPAYDIFSMSIMGYKRFASIHRSFRVYAEPAVTEQQKADK